MSCKEYKPIPDDGLEDVQKSEITYKWEDLIGFMYAVISSLSLAVSAIFVKLLQGE